MIEPQSELSTTSIISDNSSSRSSRHHGKSIVNKALKTTISKKQKQAGWISKMLGKENQNHHHNTTNKSPIWDRFVATLNKSNPSYQPMEHSSQIYELTEMPERLVLEVERLYPGFFEQDKNSLFMQIFHTNYSGERSAPWMRMDLTTIEHGDTFFWAAPCVMVCVVQRGFINKPVRRVARCIQMSPNLSSMLPTFEYFNNLGAEDIIHHLAPKNVNNLPSSTRIFYRQIKHVVNAQEHKQALPVIYAELNLHNQCRMEEIYFPERYLADLLRCCPGVVDIKELQDAVGFRREFAFSRLNFN